MVDTTLSKEPWVACERCRQMFPPTQLYTCGPGGRWRYCGRCVNEAEAKRPQKRITEEMIAAGAEVLRLSLDPCDGTLDDPREVVREIFLVMASAAPEQPESPAKKA